MINKDVKNQSKVNRIIYNGIYGSLAWIIPLFLAFFSTPIIVHGLGAENYGIYALVLGFIGYSFNFGIGRAVTKFVSEYRAQGKFLEAGEIVASTYYLSLFLGVSANLLIILFSERIVKDILLIAPERQNMAIYALYISGATICILLVSQIYQALIQAAHRFDTFSLIINFNGVAVTIGNIILVWTGFGTLALIWWNFLLAGVSCLLFFVSSRKFLPEIKPNFKFNGKSIKLLGRFGLGIFTYQVFGNLIFLFERGWIIRRFGEDALTYYVVPMSLGISILSFTVSLVQVVFPVISELQNEREKIIKLYQKSTKVVLTIISFIVLSLICGGKLLLSLWISPEFAINSYEILSFHALSFGILSVYTVSWQLAEGFGKPKINAFVSFVWLIVSIPAMVYFSYSWGENGIAFARFLAIALSFPAIFYTEKRFLGNIQYSFWLKKILTLTVAIIVSSLVETWIFGIFDEKWFTLLLGGIAGFAAFLGCLLILGFVTEDEKILVKQLLNR